MAPAQAEAWIDLIIARAPALRAAGVTSLAFDGGASILLLPEPPPAVDLGPPPRIEDPILDAMNDPATFGGVLPGYRIPAYQPEEDIP